MLACNSKATYMVGLLSSLCLSLWLGLALGFVFLYFLFVNHERNTKDNNLPHGSMGWPLLGETLAFLKPHKSNSMGSFLQERCSRYGRVFKSHLFGCPTIVSCDHELNMFILQNEEKLFQSSYPKPIHKILGEQCLLVVVGDVHKKIRSIVLSFTNICKSKPEYLDGIDKLATSMMESWKERNEVIFCKEANKFTFNVMVKQILSLEPEDPLTSKILEDFRTFMKGVVSLPLHVPGTSYAKAVKARGRIKSTVRAMMEERSKWGVGLAKGDFLDVLLSSRDLTDNVKESIVLDLLLAGYETTSNLLAITVYFLGHTHIALKQLKEEHHGIRKEKKKGEALSWEDYKKMEFTQNVINEALRCGNIVKFVHRKALKDVNYKGYFIPSGWKILPVFTAVHLNPSLHENALQFNPWRWTDQAGTGKTMQPFGGGQRLCPGAELGKLEVAFFLHHLVLNYGWRTKVEDYPVAYPYVEFKRGLPLDIEPTETGLEELLQS